MSWLPCEVKFQGKAAGHSAAGVIVALEMIMVLFGSS